MCSLRWGKVILLGWIFAAGCATPPPPVKLTPGASVDTLSSSISVSAKGAEGGGSARGYLLYRRPDRLHVLFLSPFGSTMFEIFLQGDQVTCLVPDKKTAYLGEVNALAQGNYLKTLRLMRWVLARPPVSGPSLGARELDSDEVGKEKVFFLENGLVERKVAEKGEEVIYHDYQMVDGIPFAQRMEIRDGKGGEVRITFDDPEVNRPIEEESLAPKLKGYEVLPLHLLRNAP